MCLHSTTIVQDQSHFYCARKDYRQSYYGQETYAEINSSIKNKCPRKCYEDN